MKPKIFMTLSVVLLTVFSLSAYTQSNHIQQPTKLLFKGLDTHAAKVVKQFHQALKTVDALTVQSVLSEDVLIYEAGHAERSAAEYTSGHMLADMKYLNGITSELLEHQVMVKGDVAISTARSKNSREQTDEDSVTTASETIILMNIKGQWLITHIHWS